MPKSPASPTLMKAVEKVALVAASRNDPLASFDRTAALASDWGARLVDLGSVGHLNPASGFGDWPMADRLIAELQHMASQAAAS